MKHMKSNLLLALAAFIWGIAFVAQSVSMDHIGPFTFTCIRNLVAALTLYLLLPVLDKITGTTKNQLIRKLYGLVELHVDVRYVLPLCSSRLGLCIQQLEKQDF